MRPISLCNFSNKIVNKILCARLSSILDKIISLEQGAFVKGSVIQHNISLVQELTQHLKKKVRGSNVILKLDMAKTYDKLSWVRLIQVMRKIEFSKTWIDLVCAQFQITGSRY